MCGGIIVREMRREDIEDIIELVRKSKYDFTYGFYYDAVRFYPEGLWAILSGSKDLPTLVAEYEGRVISFVRYYPHWSEKSNLYVELIVTHPEYRGRGAGSALLTRCIEIAVNKGYDVVSLHTWASNRAMRLYSRLGFVWIPHTYVYMINFTPQLFRSDKIKDFFESPQNLVLSLKNPPKRLNINGHTAWRYVWSRNGEKLIAIFDTDSRRLLAIKFGDFDVELVPPEKKQYLENEEITIKLKTRSAIPVYYESKTQILWPGQHDLKMKAREKTEIIIDSLKFGFNLKTQKKLGIHAKRVEIYGNISEYEIILINNSDEAIEDNITIITADTVELIDIENTSIRIDPHSFRKLKLRFRGSGKARIIFGGEEHEVDIVGIVGGSLTREKFESYFWSVSEGSINAKIPDIYIYPEFCVGEYKIPIKSKELPWSHRDDQLEFMVRFDGRANILKMTITIIAKKDIDTKLDVIMWAYYPAIKDAWLAIPLPEDGVIVERVTHNVFPRIWPIVRYRLRRSWYAMICKDKALRFVFPSIAEFTALGISGIQLTFPLRLRQGEKIEYTLILESTTKSELLRKTKTFRALDIEQEDDYGDIILRNNWVHELGVVVKGDISYSGVLDKQSEVKIPLTRRGFGILNVIVGVEDAYERRRVAYIKPLGPIEDMKKGKLSIDIADVGASIRRILVNGEDILCWSDRPMRTPLRIPIMHGGFSVELRVDKKDLQLPLAKWRKTRPGEYCYVSEEVEILRKYLLLDEDSILIETTITNITNRNRDLELIEVLLAPRQIRWLGNSKIFIDKKRPCRIHDDTYVWLETDTTRIALAVLRPEKASVLLTAGNPTDFNPYLENRVFFELEPKQRIKIRTIITTNMEKIRAFFGHGEPI